jgi:hypothetical protein
MSYWPTSESQVLPPAPSHGHRLEMLYSIEGKEKGVWGGLSVQVMNAERRGKMKGKDKGGGTRRRGSERAKKGGGEK